MAKAPGTAGIPAELLFPLRIPAGAEPADLLAETYVSFHGEPMAPARDRKKQLLDLVTEMRQLAANPPDSRTELKAYAAFQIDAGGARWRLSVLPTSGQTSALPASGNWCRASSLLDSIPDLADTALGPAHAAAISGIALRRGLVLVCGQGGAGKTVLASSILKAWVEAVGGFAVGLRDVAELPLQETIGKTSGRPGQVIEIGYQANGIEGIIDPLLQWRASPVYLNEVRSTEQALGLLRIVTSGHLCVTTIHASGLGEAISSLETMLPGGGDRLRQILSTSLLAIVNVYADSATRRVLQESDNGGFAHTEAVRRARIVYAPQEDAQRFRTAVINGDGRTLNDIAESQDIRMKTIPDSDYTRLRSLPGALDKVLKVQ